MKGDFSRQTFRSEKHYSGVLMQQGRVQLDADWNEQQAINQHRFEIETSDVIGACGTPRHNAGFEIAVPDGSELRIGAGQCYVDGILCQNEAEIAYDAQPHLPAAPNVLESLKSEGATVGLAYLDVWQRHITALDDEYIREKALGGPDTTTRLQTVWQVKVLPLGTESIDVEVVKQRLREQVALGIVQWDKLTTPIHASSRGKLKVSTKEPVTDPEDPCVLPPTAGYRGLENQLYRVEVHKGDARNEATFKWSRDNGTVVTAITGLSGLVVQVDDVGKDDVLGFANGQWVEIIDDRKELNGKPGQLLQIDVVNAAKREITLKLPEGVALVDLDIEAFDSMHRPKLRRWDQFGETATLNGIRMGAGSIDLEHSIQVEFSDGRYETGDYWLIPARTAIGDPATTQTGGIEWPPYTTPDQAPDLYVPLGIEHHYCPLAIIRRAGDVLTAEDCRLILPPLNHLTADDVRFDNRACGAELADAETVQEAIDLLCQINKNGCTLVAIPGEGWGRIFDEIGKNQDVHICFQVGTYELEETITLEDKGNVKITGCGTGTRIIASKAEAVFRFRNCKSVVVRDIYAESGATGSKGKTRDLNGTLSFCGCANVTVEGVSLECAAGTKRAATCITVIDTCDSDPDENRTISPGSVRIRHCDLGIGHRQVGILLVNVHRAQVEDNHLRVSKKPRSLTLARLLQDKEQRAMARKLLVSGAHLGEEPPPEKETNATVAFGGHVIHFRTEKSLVDEWQRMVDLEPPITRVESARDLLAHVTKIADRVILNEGVLGDLRVFKPWFEEIRRQNPAVASQGIVIGGQFARDVRILNNTIESVLQGIRVGVSHREERRGKPDLAGTVTIVGNTIGILLPPIGIHERFGIFIGNCDSLLLEDNYLKVQRFANTSKLYLEGVRIYGHLGKMAIVRQNHLVGFSMGIYVKPLNYHEFKTPQWLVADNVASVKVEGSKVRQSFNYA